VVLWIAILFCWIRFFPASSGFSGITLLALYETYCLLNETAYQKKYREQEQAKKIYKQKFGRWYWLAKNGFWIPFGIASAAVMVKPTMLTVGLWLLSIAVLVIWCLSVKLRLDEKDDSIR